MLDWVAVDHFDTAHPHAHIVVPGKDDRGEDLIIARDYMTVGIRERVAELVDLDLGPRSAHEIEAGLRSEVEAERPTSIDRALLREVGPDREVAAQGGGAFEQGLRAGRLAKLSRLGLAEPAGAGRFTFAPDLEEVLRQLGERGDIIRRMQRDFTRARVHDFTLVPWAKVLERRAGQTVSGLVREAGINWSIGRGRDGPTIS
ncbi:MAG: relaxase/mobilization nuclease domain-containing protein [Sphingomonadales bacterium]|nr:relaxase/mobilization nuclease domain-containing protein [Sphingomonadales bacterium]MDE2171706.1 relaxase/mobilization nuclease domain-containing protein [Sphingomonadales bacterium]